MEITQSKCFSGANHNKTQNFTIKPCLLCLGNKPGVLEDMEVKGISRAPSHDGLCLETLGKVVLEQEECREVGHVPCDAAQQ